MRVTITIGHMKTNTIDLGIEIKNRRTDLCLTQDDLAQSSGIHIRTIQRAEKGTKIGAFTLRRILESLNLDVLSTLKKFHIEENEESQKNSTSKPKEFNPDRWLGEFQLRKAKHKLWGIEILEETAEITAQRGQADNNAPIEELDARLQELDCAYCVYQDQGEELSNEEDAIDSFDWETWEMQKEMEAWAREREEEERDLAREIEHLFPESVHV